MFLKVHSQVVSVVGITSLPNLLQVFKTKLSCYGDKILTPFPRTWLSPSSYTILHFSILKPFYLFIFSANEEDIIDFYFSVSDFDTALPSSKETRYIMQLSLHPGRNSGEYYYFCLFQWIIHTTSRPVASMVAQNYCIFLFLSPFHFWIIFVNSSVQSLYKET